MYVTDDMDLFITLGDGVLPRMQEVNADVAISLLRDLIDNRAGYATCLDVRMGAVWERKERLTSGHLSSELEPSRRGGHAVAVQVTLVAEDHTLTETQREIVEEVAEREVRQIEETNRKLRRDRIDSAKSQIATLEALDKN